MSKIAKPLWRRVAAVLLGTLIVAMGAGMVWFGVGIFLYGLNVAPYDGSTAERIFNISFGAMVLGGSVLIPFVLLRYTLKELLTAPAHHEQDPETSGDQDI